jgi:hypothetical protein
MSVSTLAGYRNLDVLKGRVLPGDLGDDSSWDDDLRAIGLAVAAEFDRFTGRLLRRAVDTVFETTADKRSVVVPAYPVESVKSVTLTSGGMTNTVTEAIQTILNQSGIIDFSGRLGSHLAKLQITYTGGYWLDAGDGTAMPAGATALPDDLLHAWFQQCRSVCDAEGTFRQKGAEKPSARKMEPALRMDTLVLTPAVRRTLQLYLRIP